MNAQQAQQVRPALSAAFENGMSNSLHHAAK